MYQIDAIRTAVHRAAEAVRAEKDYLGELDGKSGDGDLGLSMEAAFSALEEVVDGYAGSNISEMLMKAAMGCNKAAPSTMGTLLSSGVMALAKAAKGKESFSDANVVAMPRLFAQAMMARGGAKPGDKTILDVLCPLADTVEARYAKSGDLKAAFVAGAETAQAAAAATAGMRAVAGRAKWLGERAAEHVDGGAVLCAIVAKKLAE